MKHWPSQLFPIVLLGALAALTFWLQSMFAGDESQADGKLRHTPDAIAENFQIRRLAANGEVKYRLSAPHLVHYPDDDSSEIRSPVMIAYRPGQPPLTLSARQAQISARGENIELTGDVQVVREARAGQRPLTARMAKLTVQPELAIAHTASPVEITQAASRLTGVGAHIDHNASTFQLLSSVRGYYIRASKTP